MYAFQDFFFFILSHSLTTMSHKLYHLLKDFKDKVDVGKYTLWETIMRVDPPIIHSVAHSIKIISYT